MDTHKASKLRELMRHLHRIDIDSGDAFVPDFRHGFARMKDDDAEVLGEEFIAAATSAGGVDEVRGDELIDQELDGLTTEPPFDEMGEDYVEHAARKAS